jgi:hypothetical protein
MVQVSCKLKPHSIKNNACLKLVPVSLPSIVASPTTQTTTPPSLVTLYNSFAIVSKSKSNLCNLADYHKVEMLQSMKLFGILHYPPDKLY